MGLRFAEQTPLIYKSAYSLTDQFWIDSNWAGPRNASMLLTWPLNVLMGRRAHLGKSYYLKWGWWKLIAGSPWSQHESMCFFWSAKCPDVQERQPRKVIVPKTSLAEVHSTWVHKTFRWQEQQGKSYYLKWARRKLVPPWSTKRFDGRNNNSNNSNQGLVDRGGRKKVIPTLHALAFRDRRKGDPTANVVETNGTSRNKRIDIP